MTSEERYIQIMRGKSGEERLRLAFALWDLALKLTGASIKAKKPKISAKELRQEIFKRIYGIKFPSKISNK